MSAAIGSPGERQERLIGFKAHLRTEIVDGEAVYVFSERGVTALKDSGVEILAPLLDGTRDLAGLCRDVPAGFETVRVAGLLTRLAEADLLSVRDPGQPGIDADSLAYWEAAGLDPNQAMSGISGGVGLLTFGGVDDTAARDALIATGLSINDSDPAMSVVLCEDYLDPELAQVDACHRKEGRPWLLAKPSGAQLWIGPIFDPVEKACWHCLAARIWGHRQAEAHVQAALGNNGPARRAMASIPPLTASGLHLVALEAMKFLAGHRYTEQRGVWTFDSLDLRGRHHEIRRRPQCGSCGNPGLMRERAWRPVELYSRNKATGTGGGSRSRCAQEVLDAYGHLVSPVTGVIKEIRRDTRGPALFNSFRSGPNLAFGSGGLERIRTVLRTENGGKGATALDAEVSALCEALERHSGYFHGDEERVSSSFRNLGQKAIHPDECQLFHERQFHGRVEWNREHSAFQHVCARFDPDAVIDWSPVWSVTEQRHRLLPTAMLYFDAPGVASVRADSNGNAAGSSTEDALLQGVLELVERDAVALWWYNRTRAAGVDLDSFADPWIEEVRRAHAGLHREVWVLDVTSDLGIPTMVALSRRTDKQCEDIMFGFGAHLDPRVALRRCLTELNQLMPAVIDVTVDGEYGWDDPDALRWWRTATVSNQPYLVPDPARWPVTSADYDDIGEQDLFADIRVIQRKLEALGMQLLVLDQTRPDIGLPVVKAIVPGLRSFWARFAPGRLYDTPVRLGRLARPTEYEELNQFPLFL